jgi:hypothetical protein
MAQPTEMDLKTVLGKLTLEEKVSMLAAVDWWRTPVIKREGVFVPHIKVRISTTSAPSPHHAGVNSTT